MDLTNLKIVEKSASEKAADKIHKTFTENDPYHRGYLHGQISMIKCLADMARTSACKYKTMDMDDLNMILNTMFSQYEWAKEYIDEINKENWWIPKNVSKNDD